MGYMGRRVLGPVRGRADHGAAAARRGCCSSGRTCARPPSGSDAPLEHLLAWVDGPRGHARGAVLVDPVAAPAPGDARRRAARERGPGGRRAPSRRARGGPDLADLRELVARARSGGLVTLVAGPGRQAMLDRIQATMALVEGHAEHVMDAAGGPLVPGLAGAARGARAPARRALAACVDPRPRARAGAEAAPVPRRQGVLRRGRRARGARRACGARSPRPSCCPRAPSWPIRSPGSRARACGSCRPRRKPYAAAVAVTSCDAHRCTTEQLFDSCYTDGPYF